MDEIDKKLDKIEKKINKNREYEKKIDDKFNHQKKIATEELIKFWNQEFNENKEFKDNIEKIIKKFKKINPENEYNYEIRNADDGTFPIFWVIFKFSTYRKEIKFSSIPIYGQTNISFSVDYNTESDGYSFEQEEKHLKNFKLSEIKNAKEEFFKKILEIFENQNKGKFESEWLKS